MSFGLSAASIVNLYGVHPDLILVVKRAIQITAVDFKVIDGLRTVEEEAQCVATGKSMTMHSRHLTGHAIDVAALLNNKLSWDLPLYEQIAAAFRQAAIELNISLTFGAVWDRELNKLSPDLAAEVDAYRDRRAAVGKKAFLDAGHFELAWSAYP